MSVDLLEICSKDDPWIQTNYEINNKNMQINLYIIEFKFGLSNLFWIFSICLLLVATVRIKYFLINEESANLPDIAEMVRSSFEYQILILVQSNGWCLGDTEVTRGISFA